MSSGQGWKEVILEKELQGHYFCFEALDSQNPKDQSSSIAEFELIGSDGAPINRSKWKIVYADSEEVSVGNYSAEKIFDQQESTFWSTAWTVSKTSHPHQVVVNMQGKCKN